MINGDEEIRGGGAKVCKFVAERHQVNLMRGLVTTSLYLTRCSYS